MIKRLTVQEENAIFTPPVGYWGNRKKLEGLGFFNEKVCMFIEDVLNQKYNNLRSRRNRSGVAGGGLFIKADAEIVMNSVGEVCILFKNAGRINDYMRLVRGEAETIKCIRDRLGNEVKKFWKSFIFNPDNEKILTMGDNKTITFKEYRIIYELLKNRDPEKIKAKYGESDFNAIIGNKVEDQFIISAIETIKKEIANIISTREAELKETKDTYQEKCNILYKEQRQKEEKIREESSNKIAELEEQIKTLMMNVPQFTF